MNVLFYAEPLPIRNSFHQHSAVALKFADIISSNLAYLLENEIRVKIVANQHVHNELLEKRPEVRPFLHILDPEVDSKIEDMLVDWRTKGIGAWKDLMCGDGEISIYTDEILNEIKTKSFDFDVLICWGQNGALERFCENHGVLLLHMELGSIRNPFPEYLILDPRGVNGKASPLNLSIEEIEEFSETLEPHFARLLLTIDAQNQADSRTAFDAGKRVFKKGDFFQNEKVALLPLQLFDDANILLYSPFETPLDFLKKTAHLLVEQGYHVVVKTHPAAKGRPVNYLHQKECVEYAKSLPNVSILDESVSALENLELINSVDLVVTINSSLGFESLLFGKVVCVLGDAMYKVKGVFPTLEDVFSKSFDVAAYQKKAESLIGFILRNYFLSPGLVNSPKFFQRIELLKLRSAKSLRGKEFAELSDLGLNNDFLGGVALDG
ncbi:GT99 family glycosyltransferase N-terminal domain-containing protein [Microbulbifer aggregans]|uniref:capsular polysaccharide export protein, LipB/KpsS family n=1 Tax=Microbulbifer aggregans TaxID=1769779 RepID=UPI001CFD97E5|nr:hypothetical protein [Microbulbifer aggregans]